MLQQIREMFGKHKATAATSYAGLVKALADGKPMPDNAVDVAIAAGKSVQDLEADVAMLSERQQAAADLRTASTMAEEIDKLTDAYVRAAKEREALEQRHRAEMDAAHAKVRGFDSERSSLANRRDLMQRRATQLLVQSADPSIADEIASLQAERDRNRLVANTSMQRSQFIPSPLWDRATTEAKRAEHEREVSEWLGGIERREVEINARIAELEAKRLDPAACA